LEQESEQSLLAQPSTSNELTNMMIVGKHLHFLVKRCLQTMMIVVKHLHFFNEKMQGDDIQEGVCFINGKLPPPL
jgi:hypothetical protein